MKKTEILTFAGLIIVLFGLFVPILNIPISGSVSLVSFRTITSIIIAVVMINIVYQLLKKNSKESFLSSVVLLVTTISSFLITFIAVEQVKSALFSKNQGLDNNIFGGLADTITSLIMQSIRLEWGWSLLVIGSLLVLISIVMSEIEFFKNYFKTKSNLIITIVLIVASTIIPLIEYFRNYASLANTF